MRATGQNLCQFRSPTDDPADVLLWGDSHAGALMSGVEIAHGSPWHAPMRMATVSACYPHVSTSVLSGVDGLRKTRLGKVCKIV